jgi:hypothetical protein
MWRYRPKHVLVQQFPDKINCVTLHLVGYILEYSYDAQTHKRLRMTFVNALLSLALVLNSPMPGVASEYWKSKEFELE